MKSTLHINIQQEQDYTCLYNQKKLSPELLAYILDEYKGIPFHHDIEILVHSTKIISKQERDRFVDMLRSNIGQDIKECYLKLKFIQIRALLLSLLGIVFILLSFIISKQITSVLSEVFLIIGWVGIWEAVDCFLFDKTNTRFQIKKYKKLVNARVLFDEKM